MIDLYLRAATEAELAAALPWARDAGGEWVCYAKGYAIDLIGAVETVAATIDGNGAVVTPAVFDDRFHANLRLIDESLADLVPEAVRITVENPVREWLA